MLLSMHVTSVLGSIISPYVQYGLLLELHALTLVARSYALLLSAIEAMTKPQQAKRLAVTTKTVTHQATVVCSVHLLEMFNGGSDSGCEEETSLGDVTEMAVLQEGSVPERDGRAGEREGERGREREGE